MPPGNEVEKFFETLPSEDKKLVDIFEKPLPEKGNGAESLEKEGEPRKNRRTRRLETQLQEELGKVRDLRIAEEARAAQRNEGARNASPSDVPDKWIRVYGDSPESRTAWQLQKEIFDEHADKIREEARRDLQKEREDSAKKQKEFDAFIGTELETLEDEYDMDLTSSAPAAKKARREFLELVESLSPKGADGELTAYADFGEAFKIFQQKANEKNSPEAERRKELAARSMNQATGNASEQTKDRTAGFWGWQKDLNL